MQRINFQNLPNTTTPVNATNLNQLQTNVENTLNTYSTNEIRIGTWIDGKPLYRKVINFGTLPDSTTKDVSTGLNANETFLVKFSGISYRMADNSFYPLPHVSTNASNSVQLTVITNNNTLYVRTITGTDRSNMLETYITIEYTKTTD